jgi:DNA replication protein DnaC
MSLQQYAQLLRLSETAAKAESLQEEARQQNWTYLEFLEHCLALDCAKRFDSRALRRVKEAKFTVLKTLAQFDYKLNPYIKTAQIKDLSRCDFIKEARPVVLIGGSGTGKTHLATALAYEACLKGHSVRFTTAATLANELMEVSEGMSRQRLVSRYARYELLVIDEMGYVKLSNLGAQLLFQVMAERTERKSTIMTSNLPFQEWNTIIEDEKLCRAFLERVTYEADVIETGDDSVRLKKTLEKRRQTV